MDLISIGVSSDVSGRWSMSVGIFDCRHSFHMDLWTIFPSDGISFSHSNLSIDSTGSSKKQRRNEERMIDLPC